MKVGDKVTHILSGQKMTITKMGEFVAVCRLEQPDKYKFFGIEYENYTVICQYVNLVDESKQLKLIS